MNHGSRSQAITSRYSAQKQQEEEVQGVTRMPTYGYTLTMMYLPVSVVSAALSSVALWLLALLLLGLRFAIIGLTIALTLTLGLTLSLLSNYNRMIMRTERNEFDVRMPLITYSGKKALVCVNEETVTYPAMEGTVERTAYIYDTLWVYCDTNDEESVRKSLVRELEKRIKEYDVSDHVNEFTLAGKKMWLSKEMRVGLMNSINIEKSTKKTDTVLWFEGINYTIPIDVALQMLAQLELYALSCYNVTQQHLSEVSGLSTLEELINYDYTRGYPSKLVFNLG